ncbi:hypothetical protein [Colwellia sp. Bg11-28]|uniref:hypothetical protein n=1 Tax=Colwellia sp. Bg11-28 TaxID=2058305 RepID=UPI000C323A72|nr:hypothetical protein [Colwellia sp. Bg11-28]PKH87909.1 hypothetical protein CXF79_14930 [Colwellia sp. Bg11-28]
MNEGEYTPRLLVEKSFLGLFSTCFLALEKLDVTDTGICYRTKKNKELGSISAENIKSAIGVKTYNRLEEVHNKYALLIEGAISSDEKAKLRDFSAQRDAINNLNLECNNLKLTDDDKKHLKAARLQKELWEEQPVGIRRVIIMVEENKALSNNDKLIVYQANIEKIKDNKTKNIIVRIIQRVKLRDELREVKCKVKREKLSINLIEKEINHLKKKTKPSTLVGKSKSAQRITNALYQHIREGVVETTESRYYVDLKKITRDIKFETCLSDDGTLRDLLKREELASLGKKVISDISLVNSHDGNINKNLEVPVPLAKSIGFLFVFIYLAQDKFDKSIENELEQIHGEQRNNVRKVFWHSDQAKAVNGVRSSFDYPWNNNQNNLNPNAISGVINGVYYLTKLFDIGEFSYEPRTLNIRLSGFYKSLVKKTDLNTLNHNREMNVISDVFLARFCEIKYPNLAVDFFEIKKKNSKLLDARSYLCWWFNNIFGSPKSSKQVIKQFKDNKEQAHYWGPEFTKSIENLYLSENNTSSADFSSSYLNKAVFHHSVLCRQNKINSLLGLEKTIGLPLKRLRQDGYSKYIFDSLDSLKNYQLIDGTTLSTQEIEKLEDNEFIVPILEYCQHDKKEIIKYYQFHKIEHRSDRVQGKSNSEDRIIKLNYKINEPELDLVMLNAIGEMEDFFCFGAQLQSKHGVLHNVYQTMHAEHKILSELNSLVGLLVEQCNKEAIVFLLNAEVLNTRTREIFNAFFASGENRASESENFIVNAKKYKKEFKGYLENNFEKSEQHQNGNHKYYHLKNIETNIELDSFLLALKSFSQYKQETEDKVTKKPYLQSVKKDFTNMPLTASQKKNYRGYT